MPDNYTIYEQRSKLHAVLWEVTRNVTQLGIDHTNVVEKLNEKLKQTRFCVDISNQWSVSDVNCKIQLGSGRESVSFTMLHMVVRAECKDLTKLLLKIGASVNIEDSDGKIPVHYAAEYGNAEVIKLLIDKDQSTVNKADEYGCIPLHYAARHGNAKVAKILLDTGQCAVDKEDKCGRTPLGSVRYGERKGVMKVLIKNGAEISKLKHDKFNSYMRSEYVDTMRETISRSLFPLHYASAYGYEETAKVLLDKDPALVNKQDKHGHIPLYYAFYAGEKKTIKVLRENGADVESLDDETQMCLHDYDAEMADGAAMKATIAAVIASVIVVAVTTPLVFIHFTTLSTLAITGITIVSTIVVGMLVNEMSTWLSEPKFSAHTHKAVSVYGLYKYSLQ